MMTHSAALLKNLRDRAPLIWTITNFVAMDFTANVLLAIGASPAMAHAAEEAQEFAALTKAVQGALTVNIGTFDKPWMQAAETAVQNARDIGLLWALDPVGAGASAFRLQNARQLLALRPAVLRGNGSEIVALATADKAGKGVDSTTSADDALDCAHRLARTSQTIVAVSGETDYVTDGSTTYAIKGGDAMICRVTASGCALTGVIGAAIATGDDPLVSTACASALYKIAAEQAAQSAVGPGSFACHFLDALANLNDEAANRADQNIQPVS